MQKLTSVPNLDIYTQKMANPLSNLYLHFLIGMPFCKIFTVDLTVTTHYIGQIYGADFAKFCGLLRIYELYYNDFCLFSHQIFVPWSFLEKKIKS